MLSTIKAFREGNLSKEAFEYEWFKTLYSKPKKLNNGRLVQESWTSHPISQAMVELRKHAPVCIKKSITQCIKYSKMWWSKSTDTYLFPAYAMCLFLDSLHHTESPIKMLNKEKTMDVWKNMFWQPYDHATVSLIAMDQHTGQGSKNGIGKGTPYALPSFVLYHSAVRPYTNGKEDTILKYIEERLPELPEDMRTIHYEAMKQFSAGMLDHKALWDSFVSCLIRMGIPKPVPPTYWKDIIQTRPSKTIANVYHPVSDCHFHFKCSPIRDGFALDVLISFMQKAIRRSMLWESVWVVSKLLLFALFHHETTSGTLWTIYPAAQAKVTNMINRLIVITAEDIFPDSVIFYEATHVLETARKSLLALKEPQPEDLYRQRFESLVVNVMSVVVSLVSVPKQHYVGMVLFKQEHQKLYQAAISNLSTPELGEKRKREGKITNFFNRK